MNSCSDKLVGTYFSGSRILKLSLDSSYKYEEQLCLLSHTSEGKWQFVDGKIILNNYFPSNSLPIHVDINKTNTVKSGFLKLHIVNDNKFLKSKLYEGIEVILNGRKFEFDDFGDYNIPFGSQLSSIKVNLLPNKSTLTNVHDVISTYEFLIDTHKGDSVSIITHFSVDHMFQKDIINDTLLFRKSMLIWRSQNNRPYKFKK